MKRFFLFAMAVLMTLASCTKTSVESIPEVGQVPTSSFQVSLDFDAPASQSTANILLIDNYGMTVMSKTVDITSGIVTMHTTGDTAPVALFTKGLVNGDRPDGSLTISSGVVTKGGGPVKVIIRD